MSPSSRYLIAAYELSDGGMTYLVEIADSQIVQFGPYDKATSTSLAGVLFPGFELFWLPKQLRKLDDEAALILGNAQLSKAVDSE
ncbi:hypothetical protein LDP08_02480 [Ralstonia pseudosolanacearum]|uniref:hypothetical protein n=1 Tax=Ralstonia pseudosolanacearum TaxID=1310165 RepID=UPI003CEE74DB